MPQVSIFTPSPKTTISPLKKRSLDDDITAVDGVTEVRSSVKNDCNYSASVTGGTVAAIDNALRPSVPEDWILTVD